MRKTALVLVAAAGLASCQSAPERERTAPSPAPPSPTPAPQVATRVAGKTFVLVVGIDSYKDPKVAALDFAERDASDVYAFFATDARSPADRDRVRPLYGKD